MYIGGVDSKGLHHLVWEIVDNSVDEYLNGHADTITVTLHKSGDAVTVSDNGRGIPVDMHPKHKKSGAGADPHHAALRRQVRRGRTATSTPAACTASARRSSTPCRRSSSPPSAATATSGSRATPAASPPGQLEKLGPFRGHGTRIYFEPDPTIFKTTHFDADLIKEHLEAMSYIHSGLKITFKDEKTGETSTSPTRGGIPEFLTRLITEGQKPTVTEPPFTVARDDGDEDGSRPAVDRVHRRGDPLLRQRHPHRRPAARTRRASRAPSPRPSATTWRPTTSRSRGWRSRPRTSARAIVGRPVRLRPRADVPGADQGEAEQPGDDGRRRGLRPPGPGELAQRQHDGRRARSSAGSSWPPRPARRRGGGHRGQAQVGHVPPAQPAGQAGRLQVDRRSTRPSCSSSRATRPAASAKQGRDNRTQAVLPLRGKILNSEGLATAKVMTNRS